MGSSAPPARKRTVHSALTLHRLRFAARLGWSEAERSRPQPVELDIAIRFAEPPGACLTDELEQTVCYDALTSKIRDLLNQESFRLIEYMAQKVYQLIRQNLMRGTEIQVFVRKVSPPIPEMQGGASFSYGDWTPNSQTVK